jgi:hypothetical protein
MRTDTDLRSKCAQLIKQLNQLLGIRRTMVIRHYAPKWARGKMLHETLKHISIGFVVATSGD